MPLMKGPSKQAFKHNVEAEVSAGKPVKQSLAIAYSMKRKAQHKAYGGLIEPEEESLQELSAEPEAESLEMPEVEESPAPETKEQRVASILAGLKRRNIGHNEG